MSKRNKTSSLMYFACVLGVTGYVSAQTEFLVENMRTNVVSDATWGDTYVGKYTDGNILEVSSGGNLSSADAFVGYEDSASTNTAIVSDNGSEWSVQNLQIGSAVNGQNLAGVVSNGTLRIEDTLSILGVANGNGFVLGDGGTLAMGSDFDASLSGFYFNSNGTLSVAGTLSNMDVIDGGRHLVLSGEDAAWLRSTNTITIGATSGGNSLTLDKGADLIFTNIWMDTSTNSFVVSSASQADIQGDLSFGGESNTVKISGNTTVHGAISDLGTDNLFTINGGTVTAYGDIFMERLDGNGGLLHMAGQNSQWTNNANIYLGSTEPGVTLLVENGALVKTEAIEIGSDSSSDNNVVLQNGGKMVLTGAGSLVHEDSTLVIKEGGWLTLEQDWDVAFAGDPTISSYDQSRGTLEFQGKAALFESHTQTGGILGDFTESGLYQMSYGYDIIVNGSSAYLDIAPYDLHVGDLSSDNTLVITNGAYAAVKTLSIGDFKEGGHSNLVLVSGEDSLMVSSDTTTIGGTLLDGIWHEGGDNNILRVEDQAVYQSAGVLHNRNSTGSSGLEIASGALVDVGGYYQGAGAYLTVLTDSSGTNTGLLRAETAEFEAGARVGVDAVSALLSSQTYTNVIVQAADLIVSGVTNGTTADLAQLDASGGTLVNYNLFLENGTNMVAVYNRRYLSESSGFNPDVMVQEIYEEIELLATNGNTAAANQLDIINLMGSDQEVALQMEQMYAYQLPSYMHNRGVFGGINQVRARGLAAHEPTRQKGRKPKGPAGPHAADQGLQGWAKVYGSLGSRDEDSGSGFVNGYDAQTYGTVIGLDQAFGEWLFGLAGGYAGSVLDGDNGDESEGTTGYGMLYANYGTKEWFGDLVLSYGLTDIDNTSGTDFGVSSSTKASQTAFYIGGGRQFEDGPSGALFRPQFGLQTSLYDQDAYKETGNVLVKDVDAYERWSSQTSLGASLSYPKKGKKMDTELELRAFWRHEFNGDDEEVGYTLDGSDLRGQFILRSPDQDIVQLGVGYVTQSKNGWQLRADIDLMLGETFTSTTFGGAVLYEF